MTGIEYKQTQAYALELVYSKLIRYAITELTEEQSKVIYDIGVELLEFRKDLIKETV